MSLLERYTYTGGETASTLDKPLCFLLALAYGGLLLSVPLLSLPDRVNYLAYPTDSFILLAKYISAGPLAVLSNAPLWLLLNGSLGLLLRPEHCLRLIIFVQAVVVTYVLLRAGGKSWLWIIALLFMPRFMENYTIHLRQGMGITVFLLGWFSTRRVARWGLMGASPFIHESFAFVVALYVMTEVMKRLRLADDVRVAVIMIVSIMVSVGLVAMARLVGARQVTEYSLTSTSVSGAAFVMWSGVLCLLLLERGNVGRYYNIALAAITFYLGTYFFSKVSGRIFESMIPLVFLCGLQLTSWRRIMFLGLTGSLAVLGWAKTFGNSAGRFF